MLHLRKLGAVILVTIYYLKLPKSIWELNIVCWMWKTSQSELTLLQGANLLIQIIHGKQIVPLFLSSILLKQSGKIVTSLTHYILHNIATPEVWFLRPVYFTMASILWLFTQQWGTPCWSGEISANSLYQCIYLHFA